MAEKETYLFTPYQGKMKTYTSPDGATTTIREQNGEDEGILSNLDSAEKGVSLVNYLAAITISDSHTPIINPDNISKWRVNKYYYALLVSRIHSLGNIMNFKLKCPSRICQDKPSTEYTVDLEEYTDEFKVQRDEKFYELPENKYKIKPFKEGKATDHVFPLSSGKVVKVDLLTVERERSLMFNTTISLDINQKLIARNLAIKTAENTYVTIARFDIFSSREMREIRAEVERVDALWEPILECECPHCKQVTPVSVIHEKDFFYPPVI